MSQIFLSPNETLTVAGSSADIFGATGTETLRIQNLAVSELTVDANIERIEFPGVSTDYKFEHKGTAIFVYYGAILVAKVGVVTQGGTGTRFAFADGATNGQLSSLSSAGLGGVAVSTTAGGATVAFVPDTADKSVTGVTVVSLTAAGPFTGTAGKDDVFEGTIGNLAGKTITGTPLDFETLKLTDGGTVAINGSLVTNVDLLLLGSAAITVSFTSGTGISAITGGANADTVSLVNLGNNLSVHLAEGNDILSVAPSTAYSGTLDGGSGTDTLQMYDQSNISNASVTGFETVLIPPGGDTILMTSAQHNIFSAINFVEGGTIVLTTADTVTGKSNVESYQLANGSNSFTDGNTGASTVSGGSGNDSILGAAGNEWLAGNSGSDTLDGGVGEDTLFGGLGADTLAGGAGNNVFLYVDPDDGGDVIQYSDYTNGSNEFHFDNAASKFGSLAIGPLDSAPATAFSTDQMGTLIALAGQSDKDLYPATFTGSTFGSTFYDAIDAAMTSGNHTGPAFFLITNGTDSVILFDPDTNLTQAGQVKEIVKIAGANILPVAIFHVVNSSGLTLYATAMTDTLTGSIYMDEFVVSDTAYINPGDVYIGGAGTDTLRLDDSGPADLSVASLTSIEVLALHSSGNDLTVSPTNLVGVQSLTGGSSNDTLSLGTGAFNLAAINMTSIEEVRFNASGNTLTVSATNLNDVLSVTGGAGSDTLVLAEEGTFTYVGKAVSSIETLTLTAGSTNLITVIPGTGLATVNNLNVPLAKLTLNATTNFGTVVANAGLVLAIGDWYYDGTGANDGVLTYFDEVANSAKTVTLVGVETGGLTGGVVLTAGDLVFTQA